MPVEPELRWRDEEREAAERLSPHEGDVQWEGVPISRCDTAQVTAWLEHREHWARPTRMSMLALAPLWTHERLMALGFELHHYGVRWVLPLVLLRHGTSHAAPLVAAFADPHSVEPALQIAQPVGHVALTAPVAQAFAVRDDPAAGAASAGGWDGRAIAPRPPPLRRCGAWVCRWRRPVALPGRGDRVVGVVAPDRGDRVVVSWRG